VAASKRAHQPASGSGLVNVAEDKSMGGGYPAGGNCQPRRPGLGGSCAGKGRRMERLRLIVLTGVLGPPSDAALLAQQGLVQGRAASAAPLQASTA
jgi:hypothetical protein